MSRTFAGEVTGPFRILPVTLPTEELIAGLNDFQPTHLNVYPSLLPRLLQRSRRGRLHISPLEILCSGEPLLPEIRHSTEETFGRIINNRYGCSELVGAETFPGSPGLHLIEDAAVYEPVDAQNLPVPTGQRAAKLLITNVNNQLLPLIRYELTDEVTFLGGPNPSPWTGRRIADIQGRLDDVLVYGEGIEIHPHLFRSRLGATPGISEYQVRQRERGAEILVQLIAAADLESLRSRLIADLRQAGIPDPDIRVMPVDMIPRFEHTGKLKRFIPLTRT
jgi:phenylacetate-coenzyme A ligase PaaK-like adenylate-forming protein